MAEPDVGPRPAPDGTVPAPTVLPPEAMRQLLVDERPRLERLVRQRMTRCLRDRESAADLVQSICGDLLRHGVAFAYRGPEQFHAWLDTVVCHKVAERLRRARAQKRDVRRLAPMNESGLDAARPGTESPSAMAQQHEELARLDRALATLSATDRELMVRRHLRGHSRERIAQDLDLPFGGIHQRIARAKARLALTLDRMAAGDGTAAAADGDP